MSQSVFGSQVVLSWRPRVLCDMAKLAISHGSIVTANEVFNDEQDLK